jgi:hypothetical protein
MDLLNGMKPLLASTVRIGVFRARRVPAVARN